MSRFQASQIRIDYRVVVVKQAALKPLGIGPFLLALALNEVRLGNYSPSRTTPSRRLLLLFERTEHYAMR
jgi:hypothetical protein